MTKITLLWMILKKLLEEARDEAKAEAANSKVEEYTRIHQSTMETEDHSKEIASAKVMAEDDALLSESNGKSEVGENTKKEVDKTLAVKGTCLAAEGIEKVDSPRTKEDDASLSETKEESEVGQNSKKGVDKTTAVKDTRLAAEGIEKVDLPKNKEEAYDYNVDDDTNLAAKDLKKCRVTLQRCKT